MPAPHAELVVDGHLPEVQLHAAIKAACRHLLPAWAGLQDADIAISFISGGISNALFKVAPVAAASGSAHGAGAADSGNGSSSAASSGPPPPVAFRVYGDNTEQFVDRSRELGIMALVHSNGFGPQVLGTFSNGRIEEFLFKRCLQPEEMAAPQFVPAIAATLRRFHDIPALGERLGRTPFARIYEWLDIAEKFTFEDPQKQEAFATFDFAALRAEVASVQAAAAAARSPIVFAHNDLLSGNIMVPLPAAAKTSSEAPAAATDGSSDGAAAACAAGDGDGGAGPSGQKDGGMTFIDFEYADWAPRGFDWGNHFCEYAGFDCDYGRYPDQQQAALFIRHYLAAGGGGAGESSSSGGSSDAAAGEAEVARCVAEANVFALAAHQYWGTWSLLQAKWSSIDFDYLSYAQLRWAEYRRRRDEFLAAAAAAFQEQQQ